MRFAINGVLVYVLSTIFICYLSFSLRMRELTPLTWNALFWIILLFSSVTAAAKSFMQESQSRQVYYYSIASPQAVIVSKIIYNALVLTLICFIAYVVYSIILKNPVQDQTLFILNLFMGSVAFSSVLTMVSGIASKANNSGTLMAILSFPVIIPVLLLLIKISKNAMDGLDRSQSLDEIMLLAAINVMVVTVSFILFPYLWKS